MTTDVLRKSVTRGDQADYTAGGFMVPGLVTGGYAGLIPLPPALYGISQANDRILADTVYMESMWAAAIGKAISKQAALGWKVKDDAKSKQRIARAQELLLTSEGGRGWVPFISKHLRSYLLRDNGAFVEIVRASGAPGSRVLGLMHLSSARCTRTGDPDYPVIYVDRQGAEHALRDHQVLTFSDMPSDEDSYFEAGTCAARRAYKMIYKLAGLEAYESEKITGSRALGVHVVSGLPPSALDDAFTDAKEDQANRGHYAYMGVVILTTLTPAAPAGYFIPLAEVPDGFDVEQTRDNGYNVYANSIGIQVGEIKPLSGQGLNGGQQSVILDEAAEGVGLAAHRKQFEHALNQYVLPTATTFYFSTNDIRDQKALADVQKTRADTRAVMVKTGEINAGESRQLAAQADDIPEEWLDQDTTPEGQLTDSEKPVDQAAVEAAQASALAPEPQPAQQAPPLRAAIQRAIAKEARLKAGPEELERLITSGVQSIAKATAALQAGEITVDEWRRQMETAINHAHYNAYELGAGESADDASVAQMVDDQREYLAKFAAEIKAADAWQPRWNSRAELYAQSAKASYWRGATAGLALPAWPGDGTSQCLGNCDCSWVIEDLGGGSYNCTWKLGATEQHCQTCPERAADWAPYQIRGGEVVE